MAVLNYLFFIVVVFSVVAAQDLWNCKKRCGTKCCEDDEECSADQTCVKGKRVDCSDGLSYCLEPTKCCGVMTCCPSNSQCCGLNTCCPVGAVCCGMSSCCPKGSTCCGFNTCCASGSYCDGTLCRRSGSSYSGFSAYYLFGVLLPLAAVLAIINYRRRQRRQAMLMRAAAEANQSSVGGRVIRPPGYDRLEPTYPVNNTPYSVTNAGYDQPPPTYDDVQASNPELVNQVQQGIPTPAAPPSYYDLYKDGEAKVDESNTSENASEQQNRSDVQEDSTESNRNKAVIS